MSDAIQVPRNLSINKAKSLLSRLLQHTTPGDAILALVYMNDTPGAHCTLSLRGSRRGPASLGQIPSVSLRGR